VKMDHYTELMLSDYQPGDMAHPVDCRSVSEVISDELHNPETWGKAFALSLLAFIALVAMYLNG